MELGLSGKNMLVTGGTGIGLACARALIDEGARVTMFPASDAASYVTGATLAMDGGAHAAP